MITKELIFNGFLFSTDKSKLNFAYIHKFLSEKSYWAKGVPLDIIKKSVEHSLAIGVYHIENGEQTQVGFARLVTDFATFGYLADVFIDESWRKRGLSKKMMDFIFGMPELKYFRRFILATADAHGLYEQFGFTALKNPQRFMEKHQPDVYKVFNS
jgi:GNAT superfamily N-acetyltransferase